MNLPYRRTGYPCGQFILYFAANGGKFIPQRFNDSFINLLPI